MSVTVGHMVVLLPLDPAEHSAPVVASSLYVDRQQAADLVAAWRGEVPPAARTCRVVVADVAVDDTAVTG